MTRRQSGMLACMALAASILLGQGCAMTFADARMLGKGRAEVTPHVSASGFASAGSESGHLSNNFGIQIIGGVHERVDFGAGYLRLQNPEGEGGTNFVGFGPKFGLTRPDTRGPHVAVATPISFGFENIDTAESFVLSPTLLTTFPVSDRVDLNPSARVIIPLSEPDETLLGLTFGVGIGPADKRFIVRPEFGIIFNPGETGVIWTVGAGMSFRR